MRIFFIPLKIKMDGMRRNDHATLFRCRTGETRLFMKNVKANIQTERNGGDFLFEITGDFADGESFFELQDGDQLLVEYGFAYGAFASFYLDMYPTEKALLPFEESSDTVLKLAANMEKAPKVVLAVSEMEKTVTRALNVNEKAETVYRKDIKYKRIMLKTDDGIVSKSLAELAAMQNTEKHTELTALFLAMSDYKDADISIANRILENCEFEQELSLLTQEEQVETFIEFSRMATTAKKEYVSDDLIQRISNSPEYQVVKEGLKRNGLGESKTQQFNVFQQVGYFSKKRQENILYNLSDMGAGKTLMTVEAIYLLDLKQISAWKKQRGQYDMEFCEVFLPNKDIIAPTLSVKSSWIDTFRLFYDVTELDEMNYRLSLTYEGITAVSEVHVASFTVKDGKIFAKGKLPAAKHMSYLIIDEIHQLVHRNVAKTKFFPPKTNPSETYKIFVLSGTMSNLKSQQWYNFLRFMGLKVSDMTPINAEVEANEKQQQYADSISRAAINIKSDQHRYFDMEPITEETYYSHTNTKKTTAYEQEFFAKYGSQIIRPYLPDSGKWDVEQMLTNKNKWRIITDPSEIDAINFELFYSIVGSRAITAQSTQIAEELFGEQKKQHVSDIIRTVSPLSKSDIQILKVLHHIAEDHNKYKSASIAKAINNAILNLNDGLQTKNIYEIVSGFAERNLRFFEYLSTLDIDILEQLPKSGLIKMPKLEDTDKFKVLEDILRREKNETHLIVVNDYYALKALSEALGIEYLTKDQLKNELEYQDILDELFEKQSIVIVTQDMIKSSLDLVQANRLVQYQLNTEISDIIQTQNRINRIGQTRETRGYYIASDQLQENLIELFLESYRNIRVAHKGIVELFADITSQINVINDYLNRAFIAMDEKENRESDEIEEVEKPAGEMSHLISENSIPENMEIVNDGGISNAILYPQNGTILVLVPLISGNAFPLGQLDPEIARQQGITGPKTVLWDIEKNQITVRVSG